MVTDRRWLEDVMLLSTPYLQVLLIRHYCLNYHRICQNIRQIHQLWDRSHSANGQRVLRAGYELPIKSWIGKSIAKTARRAVGFDWFAPSWVGEWCAPRIFAIFATRQLLQNLILPNKNSAKLLIGLAGLFVMNNFQTTLPSHKLIIILLDLNANMNPSPPSPWELVPKRENYFLPTKIFSARFLVLWLRVGSSLNFVKFLAAVAICKLNRKMRGERAGFYVSASFCRHLRWFPHLTWTLNNPLPDLSNGWH